MVIGLLTGEKLYQKLLHAHQSYLTYWSQHVLFSWQWFLGVALLVIPAIAWILWRDRRRADRLQYAGLFVALISAYLDYLGLFFGLWYYNYPVIPFTENYFPSSLTVLPIAVMSLVQFNPLKRPLFNAVLYAILSMVGLWINSQLHLVTLIHWQYIYTAIIQFVIYLTAYFIATRHKFEPLRTKKH
ncbi:MAG: CBO0543 family protein [Sporolactobacillus sp.]